MKELKRYFAYMGKNIYAYWTILTVTILVENALQVLYSYINKQTLNAVEYADMQLFKQAAVLCVIVVVLKCLFPYLRYFMIKLVRKMVFELKIKLFEKLMRLDMNFYEKNHSAEGLKTLNWDANSLKDSWFSHVYWVLGKVSLGVSALIAMFVYSPLLTGISVAICGITAATSIWLNRAMKRNAKNIQLGTVALAKKLSDILAGFSVLKIYPGAGIVTDSFLEENKDVTRKELQRVRKASVLEMLSFLFGIMGSFGTIIAGTYLVSRGVLDYGTVMAVVTLQISLSNTMQRLGSSIATFTNSLVKAGRVFDFLELTCEEEDKGKALQDFSRASIKNRASLKSRASIKISGLTFSYENQKKVFDNWSIDIKPNEKIMVKGESGCGKSTLLKLILRFYDFREGFVEICGRDIMEYPIKQVRDMITYIPQDCYLFEGTVAENIALGSSTEATRAEIEYAAELAFAEEFILKLPDKYDTQLTAGGQNLSGGQRQRIAIARAFLKNAPILMMDEPSSALDAESERMVHEALRELMKDKLVIMVTHRDSGQEDFDRVVVL